MLRQLVIIPRTASTVAAVRSTKATANSAVVSSSPLFSAAVRGIHRSSPCAFKEIVQRESEKDGVTVIEGVFTDSPHKEHLLKLPPEVESRGCPLCRLNIHNLKHTDVLVLSQFMDREGNVLPRAVTGLCARQHSRVVLRLYQAKRAGLIASEAHKPLERWQELNNYFGRTRTKTDFGKPLINILDFLRRPTTKKPWHKNEADNYKERNW